MLKVYMGSKTILARTMNRLDYNNYRGWQLPFNELGEDEGYLVEYVDGGDSNHPQHDGYISWSPKEVFESAYKENGKLDFGNALMSLKKGLKVCRTGWNGKNMFVVLSPGAQNLTSERFFNKDLQEHAESIGGFMDIRPALMLKTAQDDVAYWTPSVSDCLAEDWMII